MPNLILDIRNSVCLGMCVCVCLNCTALVYIYHEAALVDCLLNDSRLGLMQGFYLIGVGENSVRYCI